MEILLTIVAISVMLVFSIALAIGVLAAKDRIEEAWQRKWNRAHPELIPGTKEYSARFDNPDFDALESRLKCQLPQSFKDLHVKREIVREMDFVLVPPHAREFDDTWEVSCFFPADRYVVENELSSMNGAASHIPLAVDGSGGVYFLPSDETTQRDCPVWYDDSDGGAAVRVADSLTEFLSWRNATADEQDNRRLAGRSR